jgi:uncharacterized protein (TIGR00251 family)
MRLQLKVAPKASRDAVGGWMGEVLKVSVTAVPERGKANEAVVELLAQALALPKSAVRVVRGQASPQKWVEIDGLDEADVRRRLGR